MSLSWSYQTNCCYCGSHFSEGEPTKRTLEGGYLCETCPPDPEPEPAAGWKAYWAWMLREFKNWDSVAFALFLLVACVVGWWISQ